MSSVWMQHRYMLINVSIMALYWDERSAVGANKTTQTHTACYACE